MYKKTFFFATIIIFVAACTKKAPDTAAVLVPEVLKINEPTANVLTGSTFTFTLKYFNNMAVQTTPPSNVIWSSSNVAVATVSQQGIATGVTVGQAIITASYNGIVTTATLTVAQSFPERLEINEINASVVTASTFAFTLKYFNTAGVQAPVPAAVVWSSNNNNIATVTSQGLVTGIAVGQATIKAAYNNAMATASITVTAATSLESLQIVETSGSVNIGSTFTFTLRYTNPAGMITTPPAGIVWSSNNAAIATVNNSGVATGIAVGQISIKATYNSLMPSVPLTVTNTNMINSVILTPANFKEIKLNESANIIATAFNIIGQPVSGTNFTWQNDNTGFVSVNNLGLVTGLSYGTSNITATAAGIQSSPVMVQVIRRGTFAGMGSAGMAKLKFENGVLKLQTTSDFSVATGPPDLRIYLTNNISSIGSAVEIATLNQRSGAQSWIVPNTVSITQYRYVMVWCRQFTGAYGIADLDL